MTALLFVFLVFASAIALAARPAPDTDPSNALVRRSTPQHPVLKSRHRQYHEPSTDLANDHDLLDIVLVASVDGKFHALNRSSGVKLWSMSSFATTTSVSAPSSLAPLVRTSHPQPQHAVLDADDDDDGSQETYIIEPQSGAIYVLHSPSSPLQRFPFTMSKLVDISPFTSHNGDDVRVFVGKKETSLVLIELETGKIKATLNSECPPLFNWDEGDKDIDLDELEEDSTRVSAPTEVYIGRTDYHVWIYKGLNSRTPFQNLSFSVYGPNNKDNHLQTVYRRTNDNSYIQSLPNGNLLGFQLDAEAKGESNNLAWANYFDSPIVAIFDVLQPKHTATPNHAFVLLQPRPRLEDLFAINSKSPSALLPNIDNAFVGLVEETGSLFAMSPDSYPLVAFGGSERDRMINVEGGTITGKDAEKKKTIDPPRRYDPVGDADDLPVRVPHDGDGHGESLGGESRSVGSLQHCLDNPYDVRCLVGVRALDAEGGGREDRMKRLLDGPTSAPAGQQTMSPGGGPPYTGSGAGEGAGWGEGGHAGGQENASGRPGLPYDRRLGLPDHSKTRAPSSWLVGGINSASSTVWEALLVSVIFGFVSMWFVWKRVRGHVESRVKEAVEKVQMQQLSQSPSPSQQTPPVQEVEVPVVHEETNGVVEAAVKKIVPPALPLLQKEKENGASLDVPESAAPSTAIPDTAATATQDEVDESEGEGDAGGPGATPRKRARRGKRGKKKKGVLIAAPAADEEAKEKEEEKEKPSSLVLASASPKPPVVHAPSLIVSDTILGWGSHGTVVYQGSLQGRAVAVKRLLQDFVTLASREVSILQESDDHPNVIRYYYQEAHADFLYIALELCPASLADIIESPDRDQWRDIAINFDPKKALKQITSGLRHLHALKLVHRDIKPQNILISSAKGGATSGSTFGAKNGKGGAYRMLISDFGLCKKLETDQTSFLPTAHGALAAGTVGWRAPEILKGEVKLDEFGEEAGGSFSSRGSVATVQGSSSVGSNGTNGQAQGRGLTRLTKSVDIFALGCLFYYTLTNGGHPYGDRFEREVNIIKDSKDLSALERFGEEGTEATNLITKMLGYEAKGRPDTTTILLHPFFWDAGRRLNFLQDASDRFEIMCRDPRDPDLVALETGAFGVVGSDWQARLDKIFIENLGKYRKYDGRSVQDLMRALRNKKHHYQDLPDNVKRHLGPMPEGFLAYFTKRYPQLFLHVHGVVKETGLHGESMFRSYFELPDS